jgi:hypothetical protein
MRRHPGSEVRERDPVRALGEGLGRRQPLGPESRAAEDHARLPAPIDPGCRRLRPLADYADRLPSGRRGKRLNRATLWRWALRGLRSGRRLRSVSAGGTRVTCDAWVWEFFVTLGTARSVPRRQRVGGVEREQIARRLGATTRLVHPGS